MLAEQLPDVQSPTRGSPPEAAFAPAGEDRKAAVKPKRRKLWLGLAAVLLSLAGIIGYRSYAHWSLYESTDDAFIDGHIIPTSARVPGHVAHVLVTDNQPVHAGDLLVEIDPRDFETKVTQAKAALQVLEAREKAARDTATMTRTTANASVDQAEANVTLARAAVQTASADVDAAQGRKQKAEAAIAVAKAKVAQAQAQVASAEADVTKTDQDVARYKQAVEASAASRQQYDYALAASKAAYATLEAARKNVTAAEANVNAEIASKASIEAEAEQSRSRLAEAQARVKDADAKLESARSAPQQIAVSDAEAAAAAAQVEQARSALRQAELDLSYTKVYATESGRVTRKIVEAGAYIQTGETLLALVPQNVWVTANFKETQLTDMKPGEVVAIIIDAYPGRTFNAHVESIQSGTGARFSLLPPENATGNYVKVVQRVPVKITFDAPANPDVLLAPGMSVVPEVKVR